MAQSSGKKGIVRGFSFAGISCGIKESKNKDLALIVSSIPAVTAGVFTTNRVKAAPVKISMEQIDAKKAQAIIINSGNANACTGHQGMKDAKKIIRNTARELSIAEDLVHMSSTGLIGRPLPVNLITAALPSLVSNLSPIHIDDAATAIMTTDRFKKVIVKRIRIAGKTGTIAGIAKGAGMICPNMATMLSYLVTDIAVQPKALDSALRTAVNMSFNRLSVDNDMSTNDTVLAMANGMAANRPLSRTSADYRKFERALTALATDLARLIAKDGEGATKIVDIHVRGARTESDAEKVCRAVANSMLVKTALYGEDPNWGRILSAIGYSGADIDEDRVTIYLNGSRLYSKGKGIDKERVKSNLLSKEEITIRIDLGLGKKTAGFITSDLTEKYIQINAHYET